MRVYHETTFMPITIVLETQKEAITLRWVLSMALVPKHAVLERGVEAEHYGIASKLLSELRDKGEVG